MSTSPALRLWVGTSVPAFYVVLGLNQGPPVYMVSTLPKWAFLYQHRQCFKWCWLNSVMQVATFWTWARNRVSFDEFSFMCLDKGIKTPVTFVLVCFFLHSIFCFNYPFSEWGYSFGVVTGICSEMEQNWNIVVLKKRADMNTQNFFPMLKQF